MVEHVGDLEWRVVRYRIRGVERYRLEIATTRKREVADRIAALANKEGWA